MDDFFPNIFEEMKNELLYIEEELEAKTDITRRIAIRTHFAVFEALLSQLQHMLTPKMPIRFDSLSHDEKHRQFLELCALSNISYQIDEKGILKLQYPKIPFKNRILFFLNMCLKCTGNTFNPREVEGWSEFQKAIQIRNRITHPKETSDLAVSEADFRTVIKGFQWFVRCQHRALGQQFPV